VANISYSKHSSYFNLISFEGFPLLVYRVFIVLWDRSHEALRLAQPPRNDGCEFKKWFHISIESS
jgi:hypothetical protein